MKAEIKIPLSPTYALEVPKGGKITGLRIENDIPRVEVEYNPNATLKEEDWTAINLRTYMEGETRTVEVVDEEAERKFDEDGEEVVVYREEKEIIPIPEPSDKLRLLGVVATVEEGMQATWHIFEEIA